jgi:hypothetical protein
VHARATEENLAPTIAREGVAGSIRHAPTLSRFTVSRFHTLVAARFNEPATSDVIMVPWQGTNRAKSRLRRSPLRTMISREFAEHFAEEWISAWNAHDLVRILSHYENDFEMASPRIADIAGEPSGVFCGKESIGAIGRKVFGSSLTCALSKLASSSAPAASPYTIEIRWDDGS